MSGGTTKGTSRITALVKRFSHSKPAPKPPRRRRGGRKKKIAIPATGKTSKQAQVKLSAPLGTEDATIFEDMSGEGTDGANVAEPVFDGSFVAESGSDAESEDHDEDLARILAKAAKKRYNFMSHRLMTQF